MLKHLSLLGILLFLCISTNLLAKEKKIKFGKIEKECLEITQCPIDSNAHAYYIFDKGNTDFVYTQGFKLQFSRHFRIKILDETALDEASFEIPVYQGRNSRDETVNGIKAITYNLVDGNVEITKMSKKSVIKERKNDRWDIVKFALPNVKKGSVIEVEYNIASDFWSNLSSWYFQYRIPVLKSDYRVEMPEYYIYKQFPHGYVSYETVRSDGRGTITFTDGSIDYSTEVYTYSAVDVPAFPVAEYLTTVDNYITYVEFELASIEIPGSVYESYSLSWVDINKRLLEAESFGSRLKQTRCFQDQSAVFNALYASDMEKMNAAFSYIKGHTKWNGYYSVYTTQSFNKTLDSGIGNVADINLSLVGLLRSMGLDANPVVLSTRNNGFLREYLASTNNLNYVIAVCTIDGYDYLMDATNDWSSVNIIPTRCLNGKGLIVEQNRANWVTLSSGAEYRTSHSYSLKLDEQGVFTGQLVNRFYEYASYIERNQVKNSESLEKFIEDYEENIAGLSVTDYTFNNVDSLHKDVDERLKVELSDNVEIMGDMMIFKPTLCCSMKKNPLKLEERLYPVEYRFPSKETYKAMITLPEDYEIESLPQGMIYKSPSGACTFKYLLAENAGIITIVSHIERNQVIFPFNQYDELKNFYETVVTKHNETVVLKKKAESPIASAHE